MNPAAKAALTLIPLWLAGCASTPQMRDLADRTGVFVTSLDEGMAEFVEAQNRLNSRNEARLQRISADARRSKGRAEHQRLAWTSAGSDSLLATQRAASAVGGAEIAARLRQQAPQPSAIGFDGGGYSKAGTSLSEVATRPAASALLLGILEYAGAVRSGYEELQETASNSSEAAGDAATEADAAAANSATPE